MSINPKYPVLFITLPFLAGLLTTSFSSYNLPATTNTYILMFAGLIILFILAKSNQLFAALFWSSMAISSGLLGYWYLQEVNKPSGLNPFEQEVVTMTGTVKQCLRGKNGQFINININAFQPSGSSTMQCVDQVQVYLPGLRDIPLSSFIQCRGIVEVPLPSSTFEPVDWYGIRRRQGLHHVVWLSDSNQIKVLSRSMIQQKAEQLSKSLTIRLDQFVSRESSEILHAMLLGDKSIMSTQVKQIFRESGTAHVLAISGLHAGILYLFLIWVFRMIGLVLGYRGPALIFLALTGLWCYAVLTGLQPPIVRTAVLLTLIQFGRLCFREISSLSLLSLIAIGFLLYDSHLIWNTGFQLSFLAVCGILLFYGKLESQYRGNSKIISYLWGLISVTIAAQILIFPLLLFQFHHIPTYFIPASVVAVPLTGLILTGSFATILLGSVIPSLDLYGWKIIDGMVRTLYHGLDFLQKLPGSYLGPVHFDGLTLLPFTLSLVLIAYLALYRTSYPITTWSLFLIGVIFTNQGLKHRNRILVETVHNQMIIHFMTDAFCYDWQITDALTKNEINEEESKVHATFRKIPVLLPDSYQNREITKNRNLVIYDHKWFAAKELADAFTHRLDCIGLFYDCKGANQCLHKAPSQWVYCPQVLRKKGYQWIE